MEEASHKLFHNQDYFSKQDQSWNLKSQKNASNAFTLVPVQMKLLHVAYRHQKAGALGGAGQKDLKRAHMYRAELVH